MRLKSTPPTPTAEEIEKRQDEWDSLESYTLQEKALNFIFKDNYTLNNKIEQVLLKVCSLNAFYSTNIFDIFAVAKHIVNLDIDERLQNKNHKLVNDLSLIKMRNGTIKNFYSFATKYCSHHFEDDYPIYDSYVEAMLLHYKKQDRFSNFHKVNLKDYPLFCGILDEFRKFYKLDRFTLKQIDKFLWLTGKEFFEKKYY